MIVEETIFESLLAITSTPRPSPIHRYKDVYFGLASIGRTPYLIVARGGPKEKAPFVEYDLRTHEWKFVERGEFSGGASTVAIPIVEVKKLSGKVGGEIKEILGARSNSPT